jgi:hypothetical protein
VIFPVHGKPYQAKHHKERGKAVDTDYLKAIAQMMRIGICRAIAQINTSVTVQSSSGKPQDLAYKAQQHTERACGGAN